MCTLAWLPRSDGYVFWHSRDERPSRAPASAPVISEVDHIPVIAPRDGDFGGTWVGVNRQGVTIGLANLFLPRSAPPPPERISRGVLVLGLLSCRAAVEVEERLAMAPLASV